MNTLLKTEKMLKSEMNTSCSEEELEIEVIQIISKRSVSLSDYDNNGNEIMQAGKQQLESSEIKLLQGPCFSRGQLSRILGIFSESCWDIEQIVMLAINCWK